MGLNTLIGRKVGMTRIFDEMGNDFPVTILKAGPCSVVQIKTAEMEGYDACQIGFEEKSNKNINKAAKGHALKAGVEVPYILAEVDLDNVGDLDLGNVFDVDIFSLGDLVTVSGVSKGKGFAGHMKRHGFSGGRRSHGKNSVMRKSGSVGAGTSPGRIFPGMKMAGRMGNDKVTIKNLQILDIDYSSNLIFIKGSVPGSKNNYVFLRKN